MTRLKVFMKMKKTLIVCLFFCFLTSPGYTQKKSEPSLTLGFQTSIPSPVELPSGRIPLAGDQLVESNAEDGEVPLVFQCTPAIFFADRPDARDTYCVIIPEAMPAREITFKDAEYPSPFSFQDNNKGGLLLKEDNEPILMYQYGMKLAEGVPKRYKPSCYVHPLFDPGGRALTDDFLQDHFHHRGLSWMWPHVWINGKQYDLCHIYGIRNELEGLHQVFDQWTIRDAGSVCLILVPKNHWALDDGQRVMDEEALFRILKKRDRAG